MKQRYDRIFDTLDNELEDFYEKIENVTGDNVGAWIQVIALLAEDLNELPDILKTSIQNLEGSGEDIIQGATRILEDFTAAALAIEQIEDYIEKSPFERLDDETAQIGLFQAMADQRDHIRGLQEDFDGTAEATLELGNAIQVLSNLEVEAARQIRQAQDIVEGTVGGGSGLRARIARDQRTDQEQYEFLIGRAETLAEGIHLLDDPAEVARRTTEIERLMGQAYGLLSPEQISAGMGQGILDFLDQVDIAAKGRLDILGDILEKNHIEMVGAIKTGSESLLSAAEEIKVAASLLQKAADRLEGPPTVIVNVNSEESRVD